MVDEGRMSRRSFLTKAVCTLAGIAIGTVAGAVYMNKLEPRCIEINHVPIKHPAISPSFHRFTIAQFSDTHLGFHFDINQLEKVV